MPRSRGIVSGLLVLATVATLFTAVLQPGFAQDVGEEGDLQLITAPQLEDPGPPAGDVRVAVTSTGAYYRKLAAAKSRTAMYLGPAAAVPVDTLEEIAGPQSHTISVTFPGLDLSTSQYNGSGSLVPDDGVAANTRVLEATNFGLRISSTAGSTIATMALNSFFSAAQSTYDLVRDPKVYFDRNAANKRFFIIAVSANSSSKVSRIWIAVSRSAAPGGLGAFYWCRYQFNARADASTSNDSYANRPQVGFGADALVISSDNLTWSSSALVSVFVRTFRKLVLENNGSGCPSASSAAMKAFKVPTSLNYTAQSLQPVQHYTNPSSYSGVTNPVYLVATEPFGSGTTSIWLWRVANVAGTPTFAGPFLVPNGLAYSVPPDSPQPGSTDLLNTWENQIRQATGLGNTLHAVFATLCNPGGGTTESCIRYVKIGVSGPTLGASYVQRLTFGQANRFFWSPGVAVNLAGKVLVVFQLAGSTTYLRAGYTGKADAATTFETANLMPAGICRLAFGNPGWTTRTVGAQTDPGGVSFWLSGERSAPTPPLSGCWWTTDVRKVTPP